MFPDTTRVSTNTSLRADKVSLSAQERMNKSLFLLTIAALLSAFSSTACSTRANPARVRKEYAEATASLKGHSDGFFIDSTPDASASLDRKWSLQAEWVTAYLEVHPSATAAQIERSVSDLDTSLGSNVTQLGPGLYGIAIREGEIRNAFVIAQHHHRYQVVWNVKDSRPSATKESKLLQAWSAQAATRDCRSKVKDEDEVSCGPLTGISVFSPMMKKDSHDFIWTAPTPNMPA